LPGARGREGSRLDQRPRRAERVASAGHWALAAPPLLPRVPTPRLSRRRTWGRRGQPHRREPSLRERRHGRRPALGRFRAGALMSRLRAKCPDCLAYTAVALNGDYECHACGRRFAAGLVRVPRAWGDGGEGMAEAASLPLDFPEAAVIEEDSLEEQNFAVALDLPERPVILGGGVCSHLGAVAAPPRG